jgi:hypothetical protein
MKAAVLDAGALIAMAAPPRRGHAGVSACRR